MEGKDGRTEKATSKKRREERDKGNLCISPELTSMTVLLLGVLTLRFAVSGMWGRLNVSLLKSLSFEHAADLSAPAVVDRFRNGMTGFFLLMAPIFLPAMTAAIIANVAQTKPYFSMKTLELKLSPLNPVKGFKKLLSVQSFVTLLIALLKMALILVTAYVIIRPISHMFAGLVNVSSEATFGWVLSLIYRIILTVAVLFSLVAAIDWCFRKRKYEKGIMMTKQEVKDERRQYEPSPLIKKAVARRMRELSLSRMMAAVPDATVIITNPTHVAVALKYDPAKAASPRVTAKGLRLVAERIKRIARENNVPVIERPPLARELYKNIKVGNEIPARLFGAVAEVLAYLYKLGKRFNMPAA